MKYKLVWNAALLTSTPEADNDQIQVFYNAVFFEDLSNVSDVVNLVSKQLTDGFNTYLKPTDNISTKHDLNKIIGL